MIAVSRRVATARRLTLLAGSLLVPVGSACGATGTTDGDLPNDERRLLPQIVRQQEQRVRSARQMLQAAQDDLLALRLRQRMLMQHGRADLADALKPLAEDKQQEVSRLQQRLRDEEDALEAFRAHAARVGVTVRPSSGSEAAAAQNIDQPPGAP